MAFTQTSVRYGARVEVEVADDAIAQPNPCVRCSSSALITIVGRCADCISDMGRHHPDQHHAWRAELTDLIENRGE